MKITVLKSDKYIAFTNDFTIIPVVFNSLQEVESLVVNEVYRTCNFLEKRLPKECDKVEIVSKKTVKESVINLDIDLFEFGFSSKAFKDVKSLFMQCAFSFKAVTDSLETGQNYQEELSNKIAKIVGVICENKLIETTFTALDKIEEISSKDTLLAYKLAYKLCHVITYYAKVVYNENKNSNDLFYFGA